MVSNWYKYEWKSTVADEGIIIITNNANYPEIRAAYAKVESQGGKEQIMKDIKADMERFGHWANGIHFEIPGTLVPLYNGDLVSVIR